MSALSSVFGIFIAVVSLTNPPSASAQGAWSPDSALHAELLKRYAEDVDIFPRSSGVVRASNADAGSLVAFFERNGVRVDAAVADLLVRHLELIVKGRDPRSIPASRFVTGYSAGSKGLHGHLAEVDLVKANPQYRFSNSGSKSADMTIRDRDGRVVAYGQVKCLLSAEKSLDGVIVDYVTSHANGWDGKWDKEFMGWIPKDQFEQLLSGSLIDVDGRFRDPGLIDTKVRDVLRSASDFGSENQKAIRAAAARFEPGSTSRCPLRLQPLPGTYEAYQRSASALKADYGAGKSLALAPSLKATLVGSSLSLGLDSLTFAGARGPGDTGLAATSASLAALEQCRTIDGVQKLQAQRMLRSVPRWLRPQLPKVATIHSVGKWAGRLGVAVGVGFVTWDVLQYGRGEMTTREFSGAISQAAGGFAGAWAGAELGAVVGAELGSVFPGAGNAMGAAIGTAVGMAVGAWSGSEITGYVNDGVWSTFEASEVAYAVDLIRAKATAQQP